MDPTLIPALDAVYAVLERHPESPKEEESDPDGVPE